MINLIDAILASAAIPAFFNARKIAGEWYVDGGNREVLPLKAAFDCLAHGFPSEGKEIFAINPSAPVGTKEFDNANWLDIGLRALDNYGEEIQEKGEIPPVLWGNQDVTVHHIKPTIEVHDSRTIDQPLIRINSSYGYMRAFDEVGSKDPKAASRISGDIAKNRKETADVEHSLFFSRGSPVIILLI